MERPPRDVHTDRLISGTQMRFSYLIAGVVEVCSTGCMSGDLISLELSDPPQISLPP